MGLVISKGLTLRKDYRSAFADPDVQAYLSAVEQADGQALEYPVAYAVDEFVRGCKADGIWSAIKASCILAGARTRLGALTPLVGTAPTSFNFVDGDYNRKTKWDKTITMAAPTPHTIGLFRLSQTSDFASTSTRIQFYSIGNFLDLALLDARVTDLINAFAAAIP
jgi:hypothetical protein